MAYRKVKFNGYDNNNNPIKVEKNFQERLKSHKTVYAYTKEHTKISEELAKQNGRGWRIFTDTQPVKLYKSQWIEQFRKLDGETNE